jgi:hypothetical protein
VADTVVQAGGSGELDEGDADEQQGDPGQAGAGERPPGQAEQAERADAARNRRRVLEAAERLFARHGAYGFWRAHVLALLAEGGRGQDEGRLDALVDVLLAPLAPELYQYQRQQWGRSVEEITAALTDLARAVLAQAG